MTITATIAGGYSVSAGKALLRESNYYRTAEFYLRDDLWNEPEVALLSTRSRETSIAAM